MAKYRVETSNGTYEVETDEAPPLGEQPASFGGVAKTMASQAGTALSTAASDIASIPSGIGGMIRHPIDTLKAGISSPKAPQIPESELPQDAFHRFQRTMGGGPNYHPMGENTPTAEVVGHGLAINALSAAPGLIRKAPGAVDAVMERVPQGFNIAHPDVRGGVGKMAIGAALTEAVPGPLKWPVRGLTMIPGARQAYRGLVKPEAYAQEAVGELPTAKVPVSPQIEMLDKVAQGFGYKGFENAPESAKATIQDVVSKMGKRTPPPARPAPKATQEPLPQSRRIEAPPRVLTPEPPADTSGPIRGYSPTILQQEPKPQITIPPARQLGPGPRIIQMPEAPDTSGPIPFNPPEAWSAQPQARGITGPKPAPTISIPASGAAEVVERVEHPPFAKDRPFPKSQKIREQAPQVKTEETINLESQVERLRKAFPWETDQQLRARAAHANVMSKISAQPGGLKAARSLSKSLGGK